MTQPLVAKCESCFNVEKLTHLITVKPPHSSLPNFLVCGYCHQGLVHCFEGNEERIYKSLQSHRDRMKAEELEKNKEVHDKARKNKEAISIEEVCDFCWKLEYNKKWFKELTSEK